MRLITKRLLLYAASACFVVLFVLKLRSVGLLSSSSSDRTEAGSSWMIRDNKKRLDADCRVSDAIGVNLRRLMADTDDILDNLKLTHVLCYGTLWGWLKMERLLPWEDNVEFCVVNDELTGHEEAFLIRVFRRAGLSLAYDSRNGVYEVTSIGAESSCGGPVRLVVFERDSSTGETMRRIGWTRRVLPPDCQLSPSLHCFPSRLIERPLPSIVMDGRRFDVPREDVEIQKYLYPDTWWEDVKPAECS